MKTDPPPPGIAPPANLDQIESALRRIDREIWIVTAASAGRRGGLVATWVSVASIDRERPMLLAAIGPNHFTSELVQGSRAFAAHLLRPDQVDLAWNFARDSGRGRDKLAGLAIEERQTGSPILADCLAWFDCRVFARYDAGDRLFFWADIVGCSGPELLALEQPSARAEALREHHFFSQLSSQQRQTLISARNADAALYRSMHEPWRVANRW